MSEQKIIQGDCLEVMRGFPDSSVDLVVSSPPYNLGIEYANSDDEREWGEYWSFMSDVVGELFRVVRHGGRVVWNVPSFSSRQNLYHLFSGIFPSKGFEPMSEIIWDKMQITSRTAWGSFASASEPNILPRHEHISVYFKGNRNHGKGTDTISNDNFVRWTDGMWKFPPETNSEHPAPFPLELPTRAIELFSFKGETVLDPFCGYGTTLRAAKNLERGYIGIDISEEYCEKARTRLSQDSLFTPH